ncbi:hypothetical protein Chor_009979 [Crotalus horridus]
MVQQALYRGLVSTKWLAEAVRAKKIGPELRVLDASWYEPGMRNAQKEFQEQHVPGASFFDIEECKDKSSPYELMLPSEKHFADYVGHLGIGNNTHVVVYDGDNLGTFYAPRAWWMFRVFGHRTVSVLNGGFKNWLKEGHPVTSEITRPEPSAFKATLNRSLLKTYEDMVENMESKRFQVVDARSEGRFRGTEPEPGKEGIEPGHIPVTINMPFFNFLTEEGFEKPQEEIQRMFQEKKVDLSKPLIATCRKGITACHIALAAYLCGKPDVAIYDGSCLHDILTGPMVHECDNKATIRGFVNLARHLYEPKKTSGLFQGQKGLEEINSLLEYQQTPEMASPFLHYGHDLEEISPVLRYLQHPEEFTVLYQKPPKSEAEIDTASQQSEEINPVLQYLQQLEEIGSNLLQRDSCLISSCPRIVNKVETVTQVPMDTAFPVPATTYHVNKMTYHPAEKPGYKNKEQVTNNKAGVPSSKALPSRTSSASSWDISKNPEEDKTRDEFICQTPPSTQLFPAKSHNKQNHNSKTPSVQYIHHESPNICVGRRYSLDSKISLENHQKGRAASSQEHAKSIQEKTQSNNFNSDESRGKLHHSVRTELLSSPTKNIKSSCEDTEEKSVLNAKGSLASGIQNVKAEGKPLQEKRSSLMPANIKAKYGTTVVEKLISEEQSKNYYSRSEQCPNILSVGGPLETKSLMKDSYTPDVIKRAVRDPKRWHGRKTDDLGRWFQKNALNLNLQKALEQKYGEKNKGSKS